MTFFERFWSKVEVGSPDECWLWLSTVQSEGYGRFGVGGVQVYAHRVAYELAIGPIPEGLTIDHLCHVRLCCNPFHMEPVTREENTRRGPMRDRTHCPKGHPYDARNTMVRPNGWRRCRACHNEWERQRSARTKVRS